MPKDQGIESFLEDLAARTPTPGGGAASALAGAIGAALGEMGAVFTTGNPKFKEVEEDVRHYLEALKEARLALRDLAEEDAEAYAAYVVARKLPKHTEAEKSVRSERLAEAQEHATRVPEQILSTCCDALQICSGLVPICNRNLIADVAAAAQLLEACARGVTTQILGNLKPNADDAAGLARLTSARNTCAQCRRTCRSIEERVFEIMGVQDDT